ncbi:hypothetical protein ColLi_12718 [Colletotrichum liriopes]|uniref:Uncharacterized protein n=1 Tax=Colletotrichum liriopes TaxID=708192 RepID=A0AA37H062_9PEZI|nr:hypothetical protein ColLi_12718 [Colletotrichum liriopes]
MQADSALASALQPLDAESRVEYLTALAFALSQGHHPSGGSLNCLSFNLGADVLRDLLDAIATHPEVDHDHFSFKYDLSSGDARFKMPEGTVHSPMSGNLTEMIYDAARLVMPLDTFVNFDKLYNAPIKSHAVGTRKQPGSSWQVFDEDPSSLPHAKVAGEVAHSHPSSLHALDDRCRDLLIFEPGSVSAVVALKLIDSTGDQEILYNLDQCFVGV